ncbi:MAG TPA: glutamate--tRNA ligase [Terriglobales bacterium]|nr:glutamate--tRNA ligase [Terriglobales bacterium]
MQITNQPGKVRVRFAPSPTGHLHVGNARTALFNWLFARQQGGTFILRIEDTDLERHEPGSEAQIFQDLKWLGLDWDEGPDVGGPLGPYRQSERMAVYREHAERLVAEGKAYLCFCTAEELGQERKRALAEHRSPRYSGKCRALDPKESASRRAAGEAAAIRLQIPEHPIRFHDLVHGDVEFAHEVVSDPIILRSSGLPVYNYVVVIDDALMKITHVIRGDDHLSNTPKQVALYEALGWLPPEFAHLSTILGSDRERLSKRHGATSLENFREMGVLPEALMNYLGLLGWAPSGGDREIFTKDELLKEFSLERVTASPAIFDFEKLYWLNRQFVKQSGAKRVAELSLPFFIKAGWMTEQPEASARAWFEKVVELLAPSVDRLEQLPERAASIFACDAKAALASPDNADVLAWEKTRAVIEAFCRRVPAGQAMTVEGFKSIVNEVKAETGAKGKELYHPIRLVITGSHSGPEFDKLIPILEEGSGLKLQKHVKNVRERAEEFLAVFSTK